MNGSGSLPQKPCRGVTDLKSRPSKCSLAPITADQPLGVRQRGLSFNKRFLLTPDRGSDPLQIATLDASVVGSGGEAAPLCLISLEPLISLKQRERSSLMGDVTRRETLRTAAITGLSVGAVGLTGSTAFGQQEKAKREASGQQGRAGQEGEEANAEGIPYEKPTPDEVQAAEAEGETIEIRTAEGEVRQVPLPSIEGEVQAEATIPIPYAFPLGAVNIAGVLYIRTPVENSYTDGAIIGVVNCTYRLDKNKTDLSCKDPTGRILKINLRLDFGRKVLEGRACNGSLGGFPPRFRWSCSGWKTLASW